MNYRKKIWATLLKTARNWVTFSYRLNDEESSSNLLDEIKA